MNEIYYKIQSNAIRIMDRKEMIQNQNSWSTGTVIAKIFENCDDDVRFRK